MVANIVDCGLRLAVELVRHEMKEFHTMRRTSSAAKIIHYSLFILHLSESFDKPQVKGEDPDHEGQHQQQAHVA